MSDTFIDGDGIMDKIKVAENCIKKLGGIAKTSDFNSCGLTNKDIKLLCDKGFIERLKRGYYQLSESEIMTEEQMISAMLPEGIICMDSALFYYGYTDRTPLLWTIALPRTVSRSKLNIDTIFYKPYFVPTKFYDLGKNISEFNGTPLHIYDRERVICDCFRYRTKMDAEMFNKAINSYLKDENKKLNLLAKYANEMKIFNKVYDLLGVMINAG
jgi:predicted transcriptional regulator of viral defense system